MPMINILNLYIIISLLLKIYFNVRKTDNIYLQLLFKIDNRCSLDGDIFKLNNIITILSVIMSIFIKGLIDN